MCIDTIGRGVEGGQQAAAFHSRSMPIEFRAMQPGLAFLGEKKEKLPRRIGYCVYGTFLPPRNQRPQPLPCFSHPHPPGRRPARYSVARA